MQSESSKGRAAWKGIVATIALVTVISSSAWVLTDTGNSEVAPAFRIEAALPSDCLLHLSYDGVMAAKNCRSLALAQLWEEPQMKNFVKPGLSMLNEVTGEMEAQLGEMGFTMQDVEALAKGRITATLVDFAMPDPNRPPVVDVVITLDLASNQELVGRLSQFVSGMVENQMGVAPTQVDINGHVGIQVDLDGLPVTWAAAGGHLIAGTNVATLGAVLDRVKAGAGTGGLIENAEFSTAMKRCAPYGHVGWVYANVRKALATVKASPAGEDSDFQEFMGIMSLLGVDSFGSIGYGMGFEGRAIVERMHVSMPDGAKGLYKHMPLAQGELRTASMAPRESFLYEGFLIDLHGLAKSGMEALAAYDQSMADDV
ncbi:MAG: hypothetical protein KDB53_02745, partial [Planctomycetes bacterium]|nr:hypothetical protein [Planctomycetota bacterium]